MKLFPYFPFINFSLVYQNRNISKNKGVRFEFLPLGAHIPLFNPLRSAHTHTDIFPQ